MKIRTLVYIIGPLSVLLSVIGFLLDEDMKEQNVFMTLFELLAMTVLLFVFISINVIVIRFIIKQIRIAIGRKRDGA